MPTPTQIEAAAPRIARNGKPPAFDQHHSAHVARTRSDADLVYSLLYGVRHDSVHTNRGQQHGDSPEDAQQDHIEAIARSGFRNYLTHFADVRHRQAAARGAQLSLYGAHQLFRLGFGANYPLEWQTSFG